ncbi:hypothetical protein BJ742DRAFT_860150 [Cladochytrium replicatum]|nr:hypothetical protein BJ742DRAFT_860150 [Cladochytrium replicatum]
MASSKGKQSTAETVATVAAKKSDAEEFQRIPPVVLAGSTLLLYASTFYVVWMGNRKGALDMFVGIFLDFGIDIQYVPAASVFVVAVLTYFLTPFIANTGQAFTVGYDNRTPRYKRSELRGLSARLAACHSNCAETFPLIVAAVALSQNTPPLLRARLCAVHAAARILYICAYMGDFDVLRSSLYLLGNHCSYVLIASAAFPAAVNALMASSST